MRKTIRVKNKQVLIGTPGLTYLIRMRTNRNQIHMSSLRFSTKTAYFLPQRSLLRSLIRIRKRYVLRYLAKRFLNKLSTKYWKDLKTKKIHKILRKSKERLGLIKIKEGSTLIEK